MKKKPTTIQEEAQRRAEGFFKGLDQGTKDLGVGVITNQSGPVSDTETKWVYEAHIKMNERLKQQLMDDLLTGGECAFKTEVKDGKVEQTYVDPIGDELRELLSTTPPDRSKETFDQSVERYLSQIPKNETPEQRAQRINRFRCGY